MGSRINKACDGCRYRKVKCNGAHPCSQCSHLDLQCVFSPTVGKRKPGVRGRLVAQLREQNNNNPSSSQGPSPPSVGGMVKTEASPTLSVTSPVSVSLADYSADFFLRLVPDFETLVYPVNPVVTPDEIRAAVTTMHSSPEDAALVYAFATVTINLTQTSWTLNGDVAAQMTELMQRALKAHRQADLCLTMRPEGAVLGELPVTVKRVATCLFLEISFMAFKHFDRSFTILREATSLVQTLKVHQHTLDDAIFDRREVARRQRLYWECYIHERFVNVMSGLPCVLPPLKTGPPFTDLSIPSHVDIGFRRLIHLFMIMDPTFCEHWNAERLANPPEMTGEWIEAKQTELDEDELAATQEEERLRAAGQPGLTELQHADLYVTRLWMRTLLWQLALSRGLLRSSPTTHQGLSLHFPAQRLSHQLRTLVSRLESVYSIGTHGSGILQKLFEITSTIADVLALPPGQGTDVDARMEDFVFLVGFLFRFERIPKSERDYMWEKVEVLRHMYTVVDFGHLAEARSA